ncbi:type IV pilin protein [Ectopseudomonas mendocina]|uniref:Type IV pilin protein n=1 Tax=Ectopseudomonas mendocina TaxID=300 RepID=A0ABZ2RHK2_ECTME
MRRQQGFTLIELMIVIVIIGIVAAIAYPNYQQFLLKSGRSDGHSKLTQVMQAQERYYSQNQTYTTNLGAAPNGLAFPGIAANASVPSDEGRYNITAQACAAGIPLARCVALTATAAGPQTADAECGNLTLNSQGVKGRSGTAALTACW